MEEKVVEDLKNEVRKVGETKAFLERLYYHGDFSTVFNRPVLSMLMSACDYLSMNLDLLADKYMEKRRGS